MRQITAIGVCPVTDRRYATYVSDDEDRISLSGLDPEEVLRALLKVDPDSKPKPDGEEESAEDEGETTRAPSP
jgi:hypothetical protein